MLFSTVRRHEYLAIKADMVETFYKRSGGGWFYKNKTTLDDGRVLYVKCSVDDVLSRNADVSPKGHVLTKLLDKYLELENKTKHGLHQRKTPKRARV